MAFSSEEEDRLLEKLIEKTKTRYWLIPRNRWIGSVAAMIGAAFAVLFAAGLISRDAAMKGVEEALKNQGMAAALERIKNADLSLQGSEPLMRLTAVEELAKHRVHVTEKSITIRTTSNKSGAPYVATDFGDKIGLFTVTEFEFPPGAKLLGTWLVPEPNSTWGPSFKNLQTVVKGQTIQLQIRANKASDGTVPPAMIEVKVYAAYLD